MIQGSVYFPIDYLVQFTEEAELTHEVTTTDGQRHGRVRLRVQFTPDREVFAEIAQVQIIRHARTHSVGKYQSCMF